MKSLLSVDLQVNFILQLLDGLRLIALRSVFGVEGEGGWLGHMGFLLRVIEFIPIKTKLFDCVLHRADFQVLMSPIGDDHDLVNRGVVPLSMGAGPFSR